MEREVQQVRDLLIRRRRFEARGQARAWWVGALGVELVFRSGSSVSGADVGEVPPSLLVSTSFQIPSPLLSPPLPSSLSLWFYPHLLSCPCLNLVPPPFSESRIMECLVLININIPQVTAEELRPPGNPGSRVELGNLVC